MKLAQALMERSDMQEKLIAIENRIISNLKVQEGQELIEDPNELMEEYKAVNDRLTLMIQAINRTNMKTSIEGGEMTIAEALVKKEQLLNLRSMYENTVRDASNYQTRITRNEIKYLNVIDVKKVQKIADKVSKEYRELDAKIQAANWLTELED